MTKQRTNAAKKTREDAISRTASADTMMAAASRANGMDRTKAYEYGNLGDSIERRYGGGGGGLGGGDDGFQGMMGTGSSWQGQGGGNYFGSGLLNGNGRMFSGVHSGGGAGGFTYLRRFSSNSAFNHQLIASCMMAYLGYGVVRNIIDLYSDFATEGIEIDHPDESVRNFYKSWATKVDLRDRVHSMFLNLFVSGNVHVHRRWAELTNQEKRAMKSAKATEKINDMLVVRGNSKDTTIEGREAGFIDWFLSKSEIHLSDDTKNNKSTAAPKSPQDEQMPENPSKKIPWGYTFLNPLQMELRGRKLRGDSYWIMAIDKRDTLDIARGMGLYSSYNQELGTTEMNLPKEFLGRIKKYSGPGAGYSAEVKLTTEELSVIQAPGKWDWFDWAVPFCYPALRALSFKDCLRNMEMKACQSVINSIFLFKLGNIEKGMPAEDEHFERLADMLQQPGQTLNILWNEAIETEVVQADVANIFNTDKHDSADKDILTALGIPEVLVGGKGGNFSNSYIAVATVLERLESYRNKVHTWLMNELKIIADAMGFKKLPTVRFGRTSLKDEKAQQTFLMGMYDRGILSADTLLEEGGTTAEIEASKMKEEKTKYKEKDIFEPKGPFVKDPKPAPGAAGPPGAKKPAAKKPAGGPGGRPVNTGTGPTGKQDNARGPKGQGLADLLAMQEVLQRRGRAMLDHLESFISDKVLSSKAKENPNLKHVKNLRAAERERLEWLIYNVFSHMPPPEKEEDVRDEFIIHMLRSDACESVKADVFGSYTDKVAEYSTTYGKAPTREMRRQFMVSAWTQQAILEHVAEKPDLLSF
jgi:hypothetical protein